MYNYKTFKKEKKRDVMDLKNKTLINWLLIVVSRICMQF